MFSAVPDRVLGGTFAALIVLTSAFGIPLGGGEVSIMPMITLTGALVMGILPAAWAVLIRDLIYGWGRAIFPQLHGWPKNHRGLRLIGTTFANMTMHGSSVLVAGAIYLHLNGKIPIDSLRLLFVLLGAGVAYILTNYLTASLFIGMRGRGHLAYMWKYLPSQLSYEAFPIFFAPLSTQVFLHQGYFQFILFASSLIIISYLLRDQAKSHEHLQRRVKELDSLQAVGQALSASLDTKMITEAIYTEVAKLMPTSNFYVALYDQKTSEVSFPIVFEHNQRGYWPSRTMANGLTEYVINTRKPLLIKHQIQSTLQTLNVESRGEQAISWLGVPLLAGDRILGIIAVQSFQTTNQIQESFDDAHLEILTIIAAQASVAIQNSELFAQTDQALALQVRELSSILSTSLDGILLLDTDLKVLEANPAISENLEQPNSEILLSSIDQLEFARNLGFLEVPAPEVFEEIINQKIEDHREKVTLNQNPEKVFESSDHPCLWRRQHHFWMADCFPRPDRRNQTDSTARRSHPDAGTRSTLPDGHHSGRIGYDRIVDQQRGRKG